MMFNSFAVYEKNFFSAFRSENPYWQKVCWAVCCRSTGNWTLSV